MLLILAVRTGRTKTWRVNHDFNRSLRCPAHLVECYLCGMANWSFTKKGGVVFTVFLTNRCWCLSASTSSSCPMFWILKEAVLVREWAYVLFFPVPSISTLTRVTKHTDVYVVLLNVYVVLLNICKRCTVIDDARYKYPCQSWKNFTPSQGSHPDKILRNTLPQQ